MSCVREGAWQSNEAKIRVDGTEKKKTKAWINVFPALLGACVYSSVGFCNSRSITISIPGTWRYTKCLFWPKKNSQLLHYSSRSAQIIERSEWWHSIRTTCPAAASYPIIEITERQHFHNTLRVWGLLLLRTRYNIGYSSTISTTNYQPEVLDYVNINNVSGTSQPLRSSLKKSTRRN